ncbi:hypothetical protein BO70DRAFT_132966 [Aspergillus heteromorphus CBS 117.55]|uniref:Uncharacterized protein n=1 Tax=Aspergillus heteromorphus CBS 117.55 TaxID=1448321 RepID=A0A317WUE0_9EURO|nr:uncharacterized protein BO70DRAFT_132966 [Aspergillus heteromorphus CBS 117.55]PWY90034.1 hypothetical protein BO70DRAFT_132966 [Aspergillus heteromorphus CBS 117.55]
MMDDGCDLSFWAESAGLSGLFGRFAWVGLDGMGWDGMGWVTITEGGEEGQHLHYTTQHYTKLQTHTHTHTHTHTQREREREIIVLSCLGYIRLYIHTYTDNMEIYSKVPMEYDVITR